MIKIKNIINNKFSIMTEKILCLTSLLFVTFEKTVALASQESDDIGDPTKIGDAFEKAMPLIEESVKPLSAILIYVAVIVTGINILMKRNNPEERTLAMKSLAYVGMGSFILGIAGLLYSMFKGLLR